MSSKIKKYATIFLTIFLVFAGYWYFFSEKWKVVVKSEHFWHHSFINEGTNELNSIPFILKKDEIRLTDSLKKKVLALQTTFEIKDTSSIFDGEITFNHKYSVKIYVNEQFFTYIDKNFIASETESLNPNEITINEYWRNKKLRLPKDLFKNGSNNITILIYNTSEFSKIKTNRNQFSLLVRGNKNNFSTNYKIEKPKSIFSNSSLPIFKINTYGAVIPDQPKIGSKLVIANNINGKNKLSDSTNSHKILIEIRGNISQTFAKKSYSFSLEKSSPLLMLPASKKWVLYGPYADKSLIRNALTYSLYNQMGNYAPKTQFIELVINNNYRGLYLLTEKIQIGKNHLNISKLKENKKDSSSLKGGYLIEIDRSSIKAPFPNDSSAHNLYYDIYSPKAKKLSKTVIDKINSQYHTFEKQLYEKKDFYNNLDINTFADYLIITEISKNIDGYRLSTFLNNPDINSKTPKFYIGPIWDYNFSFGLTDYNEGFNPEGYVYKSDKYVPFYWHTLIADSSFNEHLKIRYAELRTSCLSNKNIKNTIDSLSDISKNSIDNNFDKWPVFNSNDFWPNYFIGKNYSEEIEYLKRWTDKRLSFLDEGFLASPKKQQLYYEVSIYNSPEWLVKVEEKAKKKGITTKEMIAIDAKFMASKEK